MRRKELFHYCYRIDFEDGFYIGARSCECVPELDSYKGSGVACLIRRGKLFEKTILSTHPTKEHAFIAEAVLLRKFCNDSRLLNLSRGHVMRLPWCGEAIFAHDFEI